MIELQQLTREKEQVTREKEQVTREKEQSDQGEGEGSGVRAYKLQEKEQVFTSSSV